MKIHGIALLIFFTAIAYAPSPEDESEKNEAYSQYISAILIKLGEPSVTIKKAITDYNEQLETKREAQSQLAEQKAIWQQVENEERQLIEQLEQIIIQDLVS